MKAIALAENTIGRQPHNGGNGDGFDERGASYTLNSTGVHGVCVVPDGSGGGIMQVEQDMTGTLRKETHGHEPVVCHPINTLTLGGRPDPVNDARMTMGVGEDGDPQFTLSKAHSHAVAVSKNQVDSAPDSLYVKGIKQGDIDASTYEADASSILSTLRKEIGEAKTTEWGFRVLDCLQQEEVLRVWLHGKSLRCASEPFGHWVLNSAPSFQEGVAGDCLRRVWENGPDGRTSQGRGLAKQLCIQLGDYLQKLSHQEAPDSQALQNLRSRCEGLRILRKALSEIQKMGEPATGEGESVCRDTDRLDSDPSETLLDCGMCREASCERLLRKTPPANESRNTREYTENQKRNSQGNVGQTPFAVRRLLPIECEKLQGFPVGYTAIPYKGKPAADGARYKALGNSMAVNVMSWIGQRIQMCDEVLMTTTNKGGSVK